MRDSRQHDPAEVDDNLRRGKTIPVKLDPTLTLSSHPALIQDERWLESQLEDPERWDGLS
jgi:hypothetical protein